MASHCKPGDNIGEKEYTWYVLHHLAFVQLCLLMLWIPLKGELAVGEAAHVVVQLEGDGHQVFQARPVVGRTGEALLL